MNNTTKCLHCGKIFPKNYVKGTKLYDQYCLICMKLSKCGDCGSRDIFEHKCCDTMECRECGNKW